MGKNQPTPTRKEAEKQRRERLRPTLTKKERKERERAIARQRSDKAYEQMERQPERVLLRNMVDSRWTLSEFTWPVMFIALAMMLSAAYFPVMAYIANYLVWALMLVIIVEVSVTWWQYKRLLAQRHPHASRRGLVLYMMSRMITMRRFRRPGTELDRGASY